MGGLLQVWAGMLTMPEKGSIAIAADYVGGTADVSSLISGRKVHNTFWKLCAIL